MSATRITPNELSAPVRQVFSARVGRSVVEDRFGEPVVRDEWLDGIGTYDAWALRFPCGLEITLTMPTEAGGPFACEESPDWADVFATEVDFEHVVDHFGLPLHETWQPVAEPLPNRHRVCRQDDHGNTFVVLETPFERRARCVAARLTASGHKQTYWVEPVA